MKIGDITLKKDYLTGGQVGNLVAEAVEIYKQGGLFDDYAFNPVDMEINFYAGLFYLLIDDYDINNNDKFEELFSKGIHKEILEKVTNAQLAYDLMWKTAKEVGSSVGKRQSSSAVSVFHYRLICRSAPRRSSRLAMGLCVPRCTHSIYLCAARMAIRA